MKYTREYEDIVDKIKEIWYYDTDVQDKGPYLVEIEYPSRFKSKITQFEEKQSTVPLTRRKFINPSNGRLVSYQRAKTLGII